MKQKKTTDLGRDSLGKLLLKLSIPAILAQLVNMLYNIVDRIYIGHIPEEGALALTGIGLCFPIIMLVTAFSCLIGMGGAPRAAIFMGKEENEKAQKILGNCVTVLIVTSLLLTMVFLVFGERLLYLFGASESTIVYALPYMKIYACGTIFVQFALGLNSFITTQGFATVSMATVVIGAALNIILDPVLIYGCHMGVQGAALATIMSQAVSAIWVLVFLCGKKTKLRIQKKDLPVKKEYLLPVLSLGVSPFVMQSTESLINISFNSSLSRYGGDMAVGAMTILTSVMQLVWMPLSGLTQGAQPIISFNFGAGNQERVRKTFRMLLISALGYSFCMGGVVLLFPQIFVSIFNKNSKELFEITVWAMRIFMAGTLVLGIQSACQQTFLALGQAKISLFLACLRKVILMIPLIFLLPHIFENKVFGVFLAEPVSDIIAVMVTGTTFFVAFPRILKKERITNGKKEAGKAGN